MAQHPHLTVQTEAASTGFTSPSSGPRTTFRRPERSRAEHAQTLVSKIEDIEPIAEERFAEQRSEGVEDGNGVYLTFESEPLFELKYESLDVTRSGIELCAVKTLGDGRTQATVFVPDGKLEFFLKRVRDYRDKEGTPRK